MKLHKINEPTSGRHNAIDWPSIVAKLRAHPGQWYQSEIPKTTANPWLIKNGISPAAFQDGNFDARVVGGMLALVFLGDDTDGRRYIDRLTEPLSEA